MSKSKWICIAHHHNGLQYAIAARTMLLISVN